MEERIICCCGAGYWTRFIAWFKIVTNAFGILFVSTALARIISARAAPEDADPKFGAAVSNLGDNGYKLVIAIFCVGLVNLTIGIAFGVILLKGSKEKNTRLLRWWIIYAYGSLILELLASVNAPSLPASLVQVLFTISVYTFAIWVVGVHIHEIEMEKAMDIAMTFGGPPPPYEFVAGKYAQSQSA